MLTYLKKNISKYQMLLIFLLMMATIVFLWKGNSSTASEVKNNHESYYFYSLINLGSQIPGITAIELLACYPGVATRVYARYEDDPDRSQSSSSESLATRQKAFETVEKHNESVKKKLIDEGLSHCLPEENWRVISKKILMLVESNTYITDYALGVMHGFNLALFTIDESRTSEIFKETCKLLSENNVLRSIPVTVNILELRENDWKTVKNKQAICESGKVNSE